MPPNAELNCRRSAVQPSCGLLLEWAHHARNRNASARRAVAAFRYVGDGARQQRQPPATHRDGCRALARVARCTPMAALPNNSVAICVGRCACSRRAISPRRGFRPGCNVTRSTATDGCASTRSPNAHQQPWFGFAHITPIRQRDYTTYLQHNAVDMQSKTRSRPCHESRKH